MNDLKIIQISPSLIYEQKGCRALQNKLKTDIRFTNEVFFPYLINQYQHQELINIMCDQFGNYLFQAILDVISNDNLQIFLNLIEKNFYDIGINIFGTRVIQKLIVVIKETKLLINFNKILFQFIDKLILTSHGNHIIQKYIEEIKYPKNENVYNFILLNFIKICINKFGCCTIQKCFQKAPKEIKEKLLDLFFQNLLFLLYEQYGTYVFQFIIENEPVFLKIKTIKLILPNLLNYCKIKYSSNVIEKCLEYNCNEIHQIILDKILEKEENIIDLILNPFGNYIIQKALCICNSKHYDFIINIIGNNIEQIQKVNFGANLLLKLASNHNKLKNFFIKRKIVYPNNF